MVLELVCALCIDLPEGVALLDLATSIQEVNSS